MPIFSTEIQTPIGTMIAFTSELGICLLEFTDRKDLEKQKSSLLTSQNAEFIIGKNEHLISLEKQLGEYFSGQRKVFDLPLVFSGTSFQEKVWNALLDISYGKTTTYKKLTNTLGDPRAIRAVANANGANKLAILVPCHRVIGTDTSLTGYAGGVGRKQFLLELESNQLQFNM